MYNILEQDIKFLPGVGPKRKELLQRELGIETYGDLLQYYPYKHVDRSKLYSVNELSTEAFVQVKGRLFLKVHDAVHLRPRLVPSQKAEEFLSGQYRIHHLRQTHHIQRALPVCPSRNGQG